MLKGGMSIVQWIAPLEGINWFFVVSQIQI
jgi:hypothetical protein